MTNIHCSYCKKLLFKANFADAEIVCGSCKRLVSIRFYTSKSLLLTPDKESNTIEASERKVADKN